MAQLETAIQFSNICLHITSQVHALICTMPRVMYPTVIMYMLLLHKYVEIHLLACSDSLTPPWGSITRHISLGHIGGSPQIHSASIRSSYHILNVSFIC